MFDFIENNINGIFKVSILCVVLFIVLGFFHVEANYKIERDYSSNWTLADKSSTLEAKSIYLSKFLASLEKGYANGEFSSHNALFLKTDDNSFAKNLEALRTLNNRLEELSKMDPNSFQYNTAIQQITQQEQGEAGEMLKVFGGCYFLANYPLLWGWIGSFLAWMLFIIGATGLFAVVVFKL